MTLEELLEGDEYLYKAFLKSKKNRTYKMSALHFENNLFVNLDKIRQELLRGKYRVSGYTQFKVWEPKERTILACTFRDKIVQHLICDNILIPLFEESCIVDNYAAQRGKGSSFGINRTKEMMCEFYDRHGMNGWIYKGDIRKYYYNINHQTAKKIVRDYFPNCEGIYWLIDMFIDSTDGICAEGYSDGVGLALGNQINTIISNLYLAKLDKYVKNILGCKYYGRYADDFYIITKSKEEAKDIESKIEEFVKALQLELNGKSQVNPFKNGIKFIGFHFWIKQGKLHISLVNSKKRAYRRKFNKLFELVKNKKRGIEKLISSYFSWRTHAEVVTEHRLFVYYDKKIKELIFNMTIENGYYVAECESNKLPVSHKNGDTFYLPINIQKTVDGIYQYEEYRFNLPIDYKFPAEILEYMAVALDEYRLSLEEVGVI